MGESPEFKNFTLTVSHKGTTHTLTLPAESSLYHLQLELEELTNVPPEFQKLLYKGKKASSLEADDTTLEAVGIKDGVKVTLMGSTAGDISGMKDAEKEMSRREEIMRRRAAMGPSKVRSTGGVSSADKLSYRFHHIEPLAHLPNPQAAHAVLTKLANDPSIQHVMQQHKFSVGVLTELAPHEHPQLLGLNQNHGQMIKLRVRTDEYDGMRTYSEVRRVLLHELTHNVWGDHDNNFKELNSQLNREVAAFEQAARTGAHTLSGYGPNSTYQPTEDASQVHTHVLGGSSGGGGDLPSESRELMRQRILEASTKRRLLEEQEIEEKCGSDGPAKIV